MRKVKVIFDNNLSIVGKKNQTGNIFSNNIQKLREFIEKNGIEERTSVCLTETIRHEGIRELTERAWSEYKCAKKDKSSLDNVLEKFSVEEIDKKEFDRRMEKLYESKIKEYDIEIIPLFTKATIPELLKRAVFYKNPFERKDKGFKDTSIWMSILEDSEKNKDTGYIIVSDDNIFGGSELEKEFENKNGNEIFFTSAGPLEEEMDTILELGKGLEEIKEEVSKKIEADISFRSQLEKKALEDLTKDIPLFFSSGILDSYGHEWRERVVNIIYNNANVNVKNLLKKGVFEIEANVIFSPKYTDSDKNSKNDTMFIQEIPFHATINRQQDQYPKGLQQKFILHYDKEKKQLEIIGAESVEPHNPFMLFTRY